MRIAAFDGEELIGGQDFPLEDLNEDRFLFISLDRSPEELTVRMTCDARRKGPSVWLNETTITPGHASVNGVPLEKSLVYNLTYTEQTHQTGRPVLLGLILFLGGLGVWLTGGLQKEKQQKQGGTAYWQRDAGQTAASGFGLALVCGALLFFYLYDTRIRIAQNTTEKVAIFQTDGKVNPGDGRKCLLESGCEASAGSDDRIWRAVLAGRRGSAS